MLVPASSQDYYKLIPLSGQGRTGKHSGGILTQRVRALSVYNSGKGWLTGQGVTGVSCDFVGVFWGTRSWYTVACAATTGPRWKVSSDLRDKSRR